MSWNISFNNLRRARRENSCNEFASLFSVVCPVNLEYSLPILVMGFQFWFWILLVTCEETMIPRPRRKIRKVYPNREPQCIFCRCYWICTTEWRITLFTEILTPGIVGLHACNFTLLYIPEMFSLQYTPHFAGAGMSLHTQL